MASIIKADNIQKVSDGSNIICGYNYKCVAQQLQL
jgi:hypothetical protein